MAGHQIPDLFLSGIERPDSRPLNLRDWDFGGQLWQPRRPRRCIRIPEGSLVGGGREVHPVREDELSVPPHFSLHARNFSLIEVGFSIFAALTVGIPKVCPLSNHQVIGKPSWRETLIFKFVRNGRDNLSIRMKTQTLERKTGPNCSGTRGIGVGEKETSLTSGAELK
jgi:hypothetical protein